MADLSFSSCCRRLWGLEDRRLELIATTLTWAVLLWSRFALLPNGPWEWDETLFARGLLHFELPAHFPHPPGFPLWLAIGWLIRPLAGSAIGGLQIASAIASVVALPLLVWLGRRLAPAPVATAAALLLLFSPGVWLHASRGFSSTAATTLALAAIVVRLGGDTRGRQLGALTLLTAAFLVRPILLPAFGLLWLACAWRMPRRRQLFGLALSLALVAGALAGMVLAEGSWASLAKAFATHFSRHSANLERNIAGIGDLGLVKGLGGWPPTLILCGLAAAGLIEVRKRLPRGSAGVWLLLLVGTSTQLLLLQNRSYSRYAVPVQLATAPLVAAGAALLLPEAAAVALLLGGAGLGTAWSFPLLVEQHERQLPGWQAVETARTIALRHDWAVVVSPGLFPFASYLWHEAGSRDHRDPPLLLSTAAPREFVGSDRPWIVVSDRPERYLPAGAGRHRLLFGEISPALRPLTQNRFLEASVEINAPLPDGETWIQEGPEGARFVWIGTQADLVLPPLPVGSRAILDLRPALGTAPVEIFHDDQLLLRIAGDALRGRVSLELQARPDRSSRLQLRRSTAYPPPGGRPLAVQIFDLEIFTPGGGLSLNLGDALARQAHGIEIDGAFPPERLGGAPAIWLRPQARLALSVGSGTLALLAWAPQDQASQTTIRLGAETVFSGDLPRVPTWIEFSLPPADGFQSIELEISSASYRPGEQGSSDTRELGIIVSELRWSAPVKDRHRWGW